MKDGTVLPFGTPAQPPARTAWVTLRLARPVGWAHPTSYTSQGFRLSFLGLAAL